MQHHWLIIFRGETLTTAEPVAITNDSTLIRSVTETILNNSPNGAAVMAQARLAGIRAALELLQQEETKCG